MANDQDWTKAAIALKDDHSETWRDRSDWYWLWRLLLEFRELVSAMLGFHKDKPEWEMLQIAAICLNWLDKRGD